MAYNPVTDFLALLRTTTGGVRTAQMPGLDFVVEALYRAGLVSLSVGQTAPTSNQATTVWFKPAIPSWTAEGAVYLWNSTIPAYQPATPTLWSLLIAGPFISLIPAAGNDLPIVDGTAFQGVSPLYSREDHVHPTDTSRAPINSPTFTGAPRAPTQTIGDSSTLLATTAFVIANGGTPPPIGSVLAYSGSASPSASYPIANGQAISRTTFAAYFAVVGITYGSGDGTTTFNIPDLRGRVVAGVDNGANRLTTATMSSQLLAGVGGAEVVTLINNNLPQHIPYTDGGHTHSATFRMGSSTTGGTLPYAGSVDNSTETVSVANATTGIDINTSGPNTAVNKVQPTMELNYIVRVS